MVRKNKYEIGLETYETNEIISNRKGKQPQFLLGAGGFLFINTFLLFFFFFFLKNITIRTLVVTEKKEV